MRLKLRLCTWAMSLVLCSASLLPAAEAPDLIPASVSAVLRLQAPKTALKEISEFVEDVQPGFGVFVSGQAGMLGVGISNPTLQGVDQSRDWYAAVFLKKGQKQPQVVFVIPATDTKALGEAIDEKFTYHAADGYGIYSESKEAVELFKAHLASESSPSVGDVASETLKGIVTNSHIALAFNLVSLKETYSDELNDLRSKAIDGIKKIQDEVPESAPGSNIKLDWVGDFVSKLAEYGRIGVEDAQAYGISITFAKSGILERDYLEFAEGSRSAGFLAQYQPDALANLNKLPANQLYYSGTSASLSELASQALLFFSNILELDDDGKAQLKEAQKLLGEVKLGGTANSFSLGDFESGLFRTVTLGDATPNDKFREVIKKFSTTFGSIQMQGVKQSTTYEEKQEVIDGLDVDLMRVEQDLAGEDGLGGLQEQIMQLMYGEDGPVTRMLFPSGSYLQTSGGGNDQAKAALEAFKAGSSGKDKVVARDLKPLGAENNIVGLVDLQTLIVDGLKLAVTHPAVPPLPFDEETLDDLKVERGYIGVSAKVTGNGYSGSIHIPKQTIKSGFQLFQFFQAIQAERSSDF